MTKTVVKEEFAAADHDVNGVGSQVQEPVDTGVTARPQDNTQNTDAPIVHAPGVGDVPQALALKALLLKLSNLPPEILAKIANEVDAASDVEVNPAGSVEDTQDANLASILSVREDIEEMFAGEELSEEFKAKAAVIYEAAVKARVVLETAEIAETLEEAKNLELRQAIEVVTEDMVNKIDRYLSYTAEEFVTENKVEIAQTIEGTVASKFMAEMFELASKYNLNIPETDLDLVEHLNSKVEELQAQLNESLESNIDTKNKLVQYETEKAFDALTEGMTTLQKTRVSQLAENLDYSDLTDYQSKVSILVETVSKNSEKKPALILEDKKIDGVPLVEDASELQSPNPMANATLARLRNFAK